jgi:DNA-binding beta-propeller fold protein YncE
MKQSGKQKALIFLAMAISLSARLASAEEPNFSVSYLYTLSNFSGILPVSWVQISVDESTNELYMLPGAGIKIFNDRGMEVYSFDNGGEFGAVADVAVSDEGDIILLTYREQRTEIIRCNYRGELKAKIELQGVPGEFSGLPFNRVIYRNRSLYLASLNDMKVIVTDSAGVFKSGFDMAALIGEEARDTGMVGFSVTREGELLFTVPAIAKAYVVSPDRSFKVFGRRGSTPGRFGVPGGIAEDASGKFILVADVLRCVITVFDKNFIFRKEFGFYGPRAGNLVGPMELAVDGLNRVYVSQNRNRGVNVYQITTGS